MDVRTWYDDRGALGQLRKDREDDGAEQRDQKS